MNRWPWLALLLAPLLATAQPEAPPGQVVPELTLLGEHPVEGIVGGNLSGLARCEGELLALSDRDDDRLYRLRTDTPVWQAEAQPFVAPPPPDQGLPWGLRVRAMAGGLVRGGELDLEGLACDARDNRYLVSEAHAAVLRLDPAGRAEWLALPAALLGQARASGMLLTFNALYEGLAVEPSGQRLWLAAERQRRGLLVVQQQGGRWRCDGGCVLEVGGGAQPSPVQPEAAPIPLDYAGLAWFDGKLFTLERNAHRICRRAPDSGALERCWSFAATAVAPERRYDSPYGLAEALHVEADGAWVGLDNNRRPRAEGDDRPIIWHFAAPAGGWGARR